MFKLHFADKSYRMVTQYWFIPFIFHSMFDVECLMFDVQNN